MDNTIIDFQFFSSIFSSDLILEKHTPEKYIQKSVESSSTSLDNGYNSVFNYLVNYCSQSFRCWLHCASSVSNCELELEI